MVNADLKRLQSLLVKKVATKNKTILVGSDLAKKIVKKRLVGPTYIFLAKKLVKNSKI